MNNVSDHEKERLDLFQILLISELRAIHESLEVIASHLEETHLIEKDLASIDRTLTFIDGKIGQ